MATPARVNALVAKFASDEATYLSHDYREAQLRREFLDEVFELLGWDVGHADDTPAADRDVIHEDALRTGSGLKAPDYSFRVRRARKFFVEAKRPIVNIKRDKASAYQLRRYAWSANLSLSLLTNFREWAIYDCRRRPSQTDTAGIARYAYFEFPELPDQWDALSTLLSRDAVSDGSLDRFAASGPRSRTMAEVDDAFLVEIEDWRQLLAQDIAARNANLPVSELNAAVQQLLDRLVFLRISEARGIEQLGQLRDLASGTNVYSELLDVFYRSDARYNSGLFHFEKESGRGEPDELAPQLNVADKPLKHIIRHMYYPDSPYEFAVLPARILGQVYERFIGSEIHIGARRSVTIELKPQVARAGGVYYTPGYIADRIVGRTVGELLDASSRTARADAKSLRVLDPACGSGSFLLAAYDYLLDWHRDYYVSKGAERFTSELYRAPDGQWRLTISERKKILTTNVFGVDIDPQAVETTKLSLLLKVLEGESAETVGQTIALFHDRALPDLDKNIQCGNSLCEPDILEWIDETESIDEAEAEIRPLDFKAAFPAVFRRSNPGFDVVVGNPPYISSLTMVEALRPEVKPYWKDRYESAAGAYDIYVLFVEEGLRLCREGGRLSYIIPNKFLAAEYAQAFRAMVLRETQFLELIDYSRTRVWRRSVYPVVPLLVRSASRRTDKLTVAVGDPAVKERVHEFAKVPRKLLVDMPDHLWSFVTHEGVGTLAHVMEAGVPLSEVAEVCGTSTVAEGSEFPSGLQSTRGQGAPPAGTAKFVITGSIDRFVDRWRTRPITYMHESYTRPVLTLADPVPARRIRQAGEAKLVLAKVARAPKGFVDYDGDFIAAYCAYAFPKPGVSATALLGVLHSNVVHFASRLMYDALAMAGGFIGFQPPQLRRLPICLPASEADVTALEDVVQRLEGIYRSLQERQPGGARDRLEKQRRAAEAELNDLVYDAYGLSKSDRAVIDLFAVANPLVAEGEDED